MNYETRLPEGKGQEITLQNRKRLEITGVKKIESLNTIEFLISTTLGMLHVEGEGLEMQHLDIEKGILWITGTIYSLEYFDERKKETKQEGFFKKIFK